MQNDFTEVDWERLNLLQFCELIPDENRAFEFAQQQGIIDTAKLCDCGRSMRLMTNKERRHGLQWACSASKSICSKRRSVLDGTWFSKSKLPVRTVFLCICGYAADLNHEQFGFITGISSPNTIVNWRAFFRDFCNEASMEEQQRAIGGEGMTVEVDESLLFKRKNHTGRLLNSEATQTWVFGGLCRETGDIFLEMVSDRSSATLLAVLLRRVAAGSRIISDCWRGYAGVELSGYEHGRVNHHYNFIDPADPSINTQRIERTWRTLKSIIPSAAKPEDRLGYLAEFHWKSKIGWFNLPIGSRIRHILLALKDISFN